MDPERRPPNTEELLASADWVRRIARRLVLDPERAEDVAQDALAVALERRPGFGSDPRRMRRWLSGVVRHLAARGRREVERPTREREAGQRRESAPATDDVVTRLELHRLLTAAVLELDEPYRTTVVLRYFDGLTPRAISARQGVEGATVRKRLERANAQLRAKLDRRFDGGRGAWCAVLAPLAQTGSMTAASGTGAVLMGTKAMVGLAAAAGALVAWMAWDGGDARAPVPESRELANGIELEGAAPARAASTRVAAEEPEARSALGVARPIRQLVRVVAAETRAPIANAFVLALDGAGELARARTATDGRAVLPAGFAPARVAACAEGWNAVASLVEGAQIEVALRPEGVLTGVVIVDGAPPGKPLELTVQTSEGLDELDLLGAFADELRAERGFHGDGAVFTNAQGRFAVRGLDPDWSGRLRVLGGLRIRSSTPELPTRKHASVDLRVLVEDLRLETTQLPLLRGRVVSAETGASIARAVLDIRVEFDAGELDTSSVGCLADDDGRFAFPVQPAYTRARERWIDTAERATPVRIAITLRGDDQTSVAEFAFEAAELADPLDVGDLPVARSAPLWFRVVDDGGRPIADARVSAAGRASPLTDAEGRASLRGLPAGPVALTVAAFGHRVLLLEHGVHRGSQADPVELALAASNVVEVQLVGPEGDAPEGLTVELDLPLDAICGYGPTQVGSTAVGRLAGPFGGRTWNSERMKLGLRPRADGSIAMSGLLPGLECTLRVSDCIGQLAAERRFVTPADGERLVLRVEVAAPEVELRGRVLDEEGAPIAEVDVEVRHARTSFTPRTDADGRFAVGPLLAAGGAEVRLELSYPGRVTRLFDHVRVERGAAELELVLERGCALEVELVQASGRPAPVDYLGARAPGFARIYAELEGGRFAFEGLPPGEVELVADVGGHAHRFQVLGSDERARFTLPDHGALEVELAPDLAEGDDLWARLTLAGVADFEHLAWLGDPIALQPGSYEVELVRQSWTEKERPVQPLEGPLPIEVRAGETAHVRFGD